MSDESAQETWSAFVETLSRMPDVIVRLVEQHAPTADGMCMACTYGGTGRRTTPWPCSIHGLAERASELRRTRSR